MFFDSIGHLDRSARKNEIRDELMFLAGEHSHPISKARAEKLADKYKRGLFDPELARVIAWSDPTGERAVENVLRAA